MNKTSLALKSSYISTSITLILGVLTFWRTSIIIQEYGVFTNSVSQVATQLFSYLVLLESGLGAAYLFKMYNPLNDKNYEKVYSLYLGLKIKLQKVSIWMFIVICIISISYPFILTSNFNEIVQSGLIIFILGLRFVFPYYYTLSKKNVLIAEEKKYIVVTIDGIINSLIIILEILLASVFHLRIELTLLIGLLLLIISEKIYNSIFLKEYGLESKKSTLPSFEGDSMTNDIIVHQISDVANSHIDVLLLSFFNIGAVTIYSAYNSIMNYPVNIIYKIIENIRASIGLKINNNDKDIYFVFREILSLVYLACGIVIPTFLIMVNDFIELWIGERFKLGPLSVIMFSLLLFRKLNANLIYVIRDGKGLYKESKKFSIVTAILNAGLSLILVPFFSINGLLIATLMTNYFIMDFCNLKLVYHRIFSESLYVIIKDYVSLLFVFFLSSSLSIYILTSFFTEGELSWGIFISKAIIVVSVSIIIIFLYLVLFNDAFIRLLKRFKNMLSK